MKLYPEIQEIVKIKTEWSNFIEKNTFDIQFSGMQICSVHSIDSIKAKAAELNAKLQKQCEVIKATLPEWEKQARDNNSYNAETFPTVEYFNNNYVIKVLPVPLFSKHIDLEESESLEREILQSSVEKMTSVIVDALSAVSDFVTGNKKKFNDGILTKVSETLKVVSDSNIINGEQFEAFETQVTSIMDTINADVIRDHKAIVDKGVVVPSTEKKRGRKATPITQETVEKSEKILTETVEKLASLETQCQGLV